MVQQVAAAEAGPEHQIQAQLLPQDEPTHLEQGGNERLGVLLLRRGIVLSHRHVVLNLQARGRGGGQGQEHGKKQKQRLETARWRASCRAGPRAGATSKQLQ